MIQIFCVLNRITKNMSDVTAPNFSSSLVVHNH